MRLGKLKVCGLFIFAWIHYSLESLPLSCDLVCEADLKFWHYQTHQHSPEQLAPYLSFHHRPADRLNIDLTFWAFFLFLVCVFCSLCPRLSLGLNPVIASSEGGWLALRSVRGRKGLNIKWCFLQFTQFSLELIQSLKRILLFLFDENKSVMIHSLSIFQFTWNELVYWLWVNAEAETFCR